MITKQPRTCQDPRMTDTFAPPPEGNPQPAAAPQQYGPAGYLQTPGPPGQSRGIGASIALAIITFGIYTYVWTWKTHEEIKRHAGVGVGGPVGFLIYIVISPVTFFLLAGEVRQMLARTGQTSRVQGTTGLWILLPLVGPLVWFIKVQGQLNDYWAGTRS